MNPYTMLAGEKFEDFGDVQGGSGRKDIPEDL